MTDLIKATGLWRKTSAKSGKDYFVGRLGGLRVLIFENANRENDDDPTHLLMFGEAEDKRDQRREQPTRDRERHATRARAATAGRAVLEQAPRQRDTGDPGRPFDDEIPF